MRLAARSVALAAAGALTLTGCGLLDRDAPTSDSSSQTQPPPSESDLGTVTGAGRPLDEASLTAALPAPAELGKGWEADPVTTVTETQAEEVTPATCAPLVQKGPGWDEVRTTQRARTQDNYRVATNPPPPGTVRHHMGVWAYSFGDPYPTRLFEEAGALVADCASFSVKQVDTGNTSSYEATPLTFPTLGDRTVALRLTVRQSIETLTIDFVVVKVGHNTVTVANATYNGTPDTAVTEKAARATLDGLEDD